MAHEAQTVRKIFEWIGRERCSIGEVCRRLKDQGIATRTGKAAWDRSSVWGMLKNPAYKGSGGLRQDESGAVQAAETPAPERPPPASQETGLSDRYGVGGPDHHRGPRDRRRGPLRRRPGPTGGEPATQTCSAPGAGYLVQGLIVCKRCGYGCYGKPTSRASAKGRIPYAYYRCTGSDAYRFGGQRLCWNKQVRTDLLDAAVWEDVRKPSGRAGADPGRVRATPAEDRARRSPGGGPNHEVDHTG